MKMRFLGRLVCIWAMAATCCWFVAGVAHSEQGGGKVLSIKVRTTQVRKSPAFFGAAVKSLSYGDTVTALEPKGDWIKISLGKLGQGYVHSSAVTAQKIIRSGSPRNMSNGVDAADVVLAGKGFNPDVEKKYAAGNQNLNFSAVDKMERRSVSDLEIITFVKTGKLKS